MIDLSLGEAETLAARVARGAGFPWGLADDIGRAARTLAMHGEPWAEALLALTRLAGELEPPSPERAARWRCGKADLPSALPICPIRTAAMLIDADIDFAGIALRLERVGLPIWLRGLLQAAGAKLQVDYGAGHALLPAADVTMSVAATRAEPPTVRRAPIAPELLAELLSIAGRIYVPESERSRARGAGGGSVDGE